MPRVLFGKCSTIAAVGFGNACFPFAFCCCRCHASKQLNIPKEVHRCKVFINFRACEQILDCKRQSLSRLFWFRDLILPSIHHKVVRRVIAPSGAEPLNVYKVPPHSFFSKSQKDGWFSRNSCGKK